MSRSRQASNTKQYKAKILICGICPEKYRISSCQDAKKVSKRQQTTHEGTTQVKK